MQRTRFFWASTVPCLLVLAAAAQEQVRGPVPPLYDDDGIEGWMTDEDRESSPFSAARFEDTYASLIADGKVVTVVASMVDELRQGNWGADEAERLVIVRQLDVLLQDVMFAFDDPGIQGALDTTEEQDLFLSRLRQTGRGVETLRPQRRPMGSIDVPVYFSQRTDDQSQWLVPYQYDDEASAQADSDVYLLLIEREHMRDWRLLEHALSNLLDQQIRKVRGENVAAIALAVKRWENYLDRGYSQYPWESLANGWVLDLPDIGPPDRQWILLHPTLGVEMSVNPLDEARVKESLNIELLGHLWYTGNEYENYLGLSAALSLREDLDPGVGVLVHFRRNLNLGITWHDVDEDPYLFFSLDLFRLVSSNSKTYIDRYQQLRNRL